MNPTARQIYYLSIDMSLNYIYGLTEYFTLIQTTFGNAIVFITDGWSKVNFIEMNGKKQSETRLENKNWIYWI